MSSFEKPAGEFAKANQRDSVSVSEEPLTPVGFEGHEEGDRLTIFVWMLVFCSSISGLLFGYDTGVISGALVTIHGDLGPSSLSSGQKELITSATTLGALLGGIIAGVISDYSGRRAVLGVSDVIFIAGAILQAFGEWWNEDSHFFGSLCLLSISPTHALFWYTLVVSCFLGAFLELLLFSVTHGTNPHRGESSSLTSSGPSIPVRLSFDGFRTMIGGRFVIGWAVGLASCIAPLYIQELAPTKQRGRMVVINVVAITGGQVIAYAIGAAFEHVPHGWRYMVGLGAVPAAFQAVCLFFLPESPRILVRRGELERTKRDFAKVYPHASEQQLDAKVDNLHRSVQESIEITQRTTVVERFITMVTVPANRRALIVGCGMQFYQQLCGFNTLMYYSATLVSFSYTSKSQHQLIVLVPPAICSDADAARKFASIGFSNPTAVGLIIAGTNFLFTLFALKYIDIIGRRRIMLYTAPGMVLALILASVSFHFLTLKTGGVLVDSSGTGGLKHKYPQGWAAIVLLSMIWYVASYATGLGNVPWHQGELFGLEVRGIGASLATASNWSSNLLINSTYLSLMDRITPAGAFGFYAGLCFLGWLFVLFCFPETKGMRLEEVTAVFETSFGVDVFQRHRRPSEDGRIERDQSREQESGEEKVPKEVV